MEFRSTFRFGSFIWSALGGGIIASGAISLYYREGDAFTLIVLGLVILVLGISGLRFIKKEEELKHREAFFAVSVNWVSAGLVGAVPYIVTGSLGFVDALFESISGFTTTGASVINDVEGLSHGLIFWRAITQGFGGMGIVILSIAVLPLIGLSGKELYSLEAGGPIKDKLTPRIQETAQLLWLTYSGVIIIAAGVYYLLGMGMFDAVCHALPTIATGGFSTRNASIGAFHQPLLEWAVLVFMFIGATNFSLHYRAFRGEISIYWKDPEFRAWVSILLVGGGVLIGCRYFGERVIDGDLIRSSLFSLVSIQATCGFVTEDFDRWHWGARFILLTAMFIGGCTGSTSGSIKVLRWIILVKYLRYHLHQTLHPKAVLPVKVGQRYISQQAGLAVLIYIISYGLLAVFGTLILTFLGKDIISAFSGVATCLGGIGPGLGEFGATETYQTLPIVGKLTLCGLMILGRLEIFPVLVLLTRTYWRP